MNGFNEHILLESIFLLVLLSASILMRQLVLLLPSAPEIKWLNFWYLYQGAFCIVHIIASLLYAEQPNFIVPLTYLTGQIISPLLVLVAVFSRRLPQLKDWYIHSSIMAITIIVYYLALNSDTGYSETDLGRPQELWQIIPSFVAMCIFLLSTTTIARFMAFGMFASFEGGMLMMESRTLFDSHFMFAHWFMILAAININIALAYLYCKNSVVKSDLCKSFLKRTHGLGKTLYEHIRNT